MPGWNGRCENRRTVAASARMEDHQNGGSIAARESIPEDGSTTANEIMTGTEGESEEGETQGKQTDNECALVALASQIPQHRRPTSTVHHRKSQHH